MKKIFIICVLALPLALAQSANEACTSDGEYVCNSCRSRSKCIAQSNGEYSLEISEVCEEPNICYKNSGTGVCGLMASPCACLGTTDGCFTDPYNSQGLIECNNGTPTHKSCSCSQIPNISTCLCETEDTSGPPDTCPSCGYADDLNPDAVCELYYECSTGTFYTEYCPSGLCFNPDTCLCE